MLSCISHVQLSVTLNYSYPGSSVHAIFQARILEWEEPSGLQSMGFRRVGHD